MSLKIRNKTIKIIRGHYADHGYTKQISNDEAMSEIANVERHARKNTLDDFYRLLHSRLVVAGVVKDSE